MSKRLDFLKARYVVFHDPPTHFSFDERSMFTIGRQDK